jgi:predicted enzyme related to lactoylglutathione lyase
VPSWFETITSDVDRARSFYAELFGWTAEEMPMPDFTYTTFKNEGQYVAGMMPILPHMGNCPSHWGTYFTVDDVDASEKLAKELGATVCIPAQDIPNVGRFAALTSPQGVMFYVITYVK